MIDKNDLLYRALANIILLGSKSMGGHHDLSSYVDQLLSITPMIDDERFQFEVDLYYGNHVEEKYSELNESSEPYVRRYWSNIYFKMLVASFAKVSDGLMFATNTAWHVKLYYNNGIVAISYYDPATKEYMAGDVFEIDLEYALQAVVDRIQWVEYGHHPSVYGVKEKVNTFRPLRDAQPCPDIATVV